MNMYFLAKMTKLIAKILIIKPIPPQRPRNISRELII